jgi:hypothetical protein
VKNGAFILTYANVLEIGVKAERLHVFKLAYPAVIEGHLGLRADGKFIPAAELDTVAEQAPIVAEIRQRETKAQ